MRFSRDQKLGMFFLLFSVLLVFIWVPTDIDTGYIEKVRRQISIGDSLAPTIAGAFLMIGGLGLIVFGGQAGETQEPTDLVALGFAALLFAVYFVSFVVMLYLGPLLVSVSNLISGEELEYRLLRDTVPWKYIGFFFGGTIAIAGTISLLEGKFVLRTLLVALIAVFAIIAVYDFPFDDLLLPPNGDV